MTGAGKVTIRMYNVGFGDCFLLTFPGLDRPRQVLIDCGSHISGSGPRPIAKVARQIVEDVTDDAGQASIDVVVATHRHFDHVAGFDDDVWASVRVGEVWLPWTENPADPVARRIHDAQNSAALGLDQAFRLVRGTEAELEIVANALSNEGAMTTLHHGFTGSPLRRFLPVEGESSLASPALPGVMVHVLGPSRDERVIRDLDPPPAQSYLSIGDGEARQRDWRPFAVGEPAASVEQQPEIRALRKALRANLFDLAVALESAVNGTSLVLAFEIGRAVLLFTGDAQWGTWQAILAEQKWRALLANTTFLKVGHHGSHNATPKELVESVLPGRLTAMCSVTPVSRWPEIPRKPLLARLAEKADVIARSDHIDEAPPTFTRGPDALYVEATIDT